MTRNAFIVALGALFVATSASAQTWTGPDESRRGHLVGHALENFETAITEICFPYILQSVEANSWMRDRRAGIVWRPDNGVFARLTTYQVGGSSATSAGVGDRGVGRECTVRPDERMDPNELFASLQALVARMPMTMTESAQPMPAGAFARRVTWCAPADGPQIAVLASVSAVDRPRGTPAMLVTIVELAARDDRCDPPA